MRVFALIFILLTFISCMPNGASDNEQTNQNSMDIQELVEEINRLNKELENAESRDSKDDTASSTSPDLEELQTEISELQDQVEANDKKQNKKVKKLEAKMRELQSKLNARISRLESSYASFTLKLDRIEEGQLRMEDTFVSLEDFESLKYKMELDLSRKLDISEMQLSGSSDPDAIKVLAAQIEALKESQAKFKASYDIYFKKAIRAWNEKLNEKIRNYQDSNRKELEVYIQNEVTRLATNIETLNEKVRVLDQRTLKHHNLLLAIAKEIKKLQTEQKAFAQTNTEIYQEITDINERTKQILKDITAEKKRLEKRLNDSDKKSSTQTKALAILVEKIRKLEAKIRNNNSSGVSGSDKGEVAELKRQVELNRKLISALNRKTQTELSDDIVNDIIFKQFSPCQNNKGLKKHAYCFTLGTMIMKLGGQFIDPFGFERNQDDFLSYMNQSGVKLSAIFKHPSAYLVPESNSYKSYYKKCHGHKDYWLLAPRTYWPRAVILSLIFEKVESDILKMKEIQGTNSTRLISSKVTPVKKVSSWWRSVCYNKALNKGKHVNSDHLYGAAFDPSMPNFQTIDYYKKFLTTHFLDHDTYGLVHPLKSSGLAFRTSVGASDQHAVSKGHRRFHFGIASETKLSGRKVNCSSWSYIVKRGGEKSRGHSSRKSCPGQ